MATAEYSDIEERLPHQVKGLPTEKQMDKALEEAEAKAARYSGIDNVRRAEANWACYYLLKNIIQVPQTETDGPISNELSEDPAAEFKRAFYSEATDPGPELV